MQVVLVVVYLRQHYRPSNLAVEDLVYEKVSLEGSPLTCSKAMIMPIASLW